MWPESLWGLRKTVLATNVEENDRAMAADSTTKALVSPPRKCYIPGRGKIVPRNRVNDQLSAAMYNQTLPHGDGTMQKLGNTTEM